MVIFNVFVWFLPCNHFSDQNKYQLSRYIALFSTVEQTNVYCKIEMNLVHSYLNFEVVLASHTLIECDMGETLRVFSLCIKVRWTFLTRTESISRIIT